MGSEFVALDDPEIPQPDAPDPTDENKLKIECFLKLQIAAELFRKYLVLDEKQTKDAYRLFHNPPLNDEALETINAAWSCHRMPRGRCWL